LGQEIYFSRLQHYQPTIGRAYAEAIPALTPLSRYERQIERSLQEAQKELETLQYARTMGCSPMYARKVRHVSLSREEPH
jgi:hypothetical protein